MPRTHSNPKTAWRYKGRVVGFIRAGIYVIDRTIARRRVKVSTRCMTLAAANAEYERFEMNPAAFVSRSGRRAFVARTTNKRPDRAARLQGAHLDRKYRLAADDYAALLSEQDGRCAICGAAPVSEDGRALNVDHDHRSGAVRGLLCGPCNRAIGQLRDDPVLVRRAAEYLERAVAQPGAYPPAQAGTSGP